jgi:hypothetical protein
VSSTLPTSATFIAHIPLNIIEAVKKLLSDDQRLTALRKHAQPVAGWDQQFTEAEKQEPVRALIDSLAAYEQTIKNQPNNTARSRADLDRKVLEIGAQILVTQRLLKSERERKTKALDEKDLLQWADFTERWRGLIFTVMRAISIATVVLCTYYVGQQILGIALPTLPVLPIR